ncbi:MAG: peptidylprolyl isomerase [Chitinophagales bacterium]|nr:peptidylprolyl isomerase [Bacteroidota bacterium]
MKWNFSTRKQIKLFTLSCICCIVGGIFSQNIGAQNKILLDKIAGIVGDKIILLSDVEAQAAQSQRQAGTISPQIKCEVMNQLLLEKLLTVQAEVDSITVSEEEIDGELDGRIRYFLQVMGGEEQFEAYHNKSVLEFKEELRDDVRDLLLARKMQGEVLADFQLTPSEVKNYFDAFPKDSIPYFNAEVELAQILIKPKVNAASMELTRQHLLDIRKDIVSGKETFEKMAQSYSEDPGSAKAGGYLGFMSRGELVPEFEAAAFKLNKGDISDIVETQYGLHIIKMIERRGNRIQVQHILIKPKLETADIERTKAKLDSIRSLIISDSLSFNEAVEKFSEDEATKSNNGLILNPADGSTLLETSELDPDMYFSIDGLKKGDISTPKKIILADGSEAYRIIWLKNRTEPHLANLQADYTKIKQMAENQKQSQILQDWIKDKSQNTYISIDEIFRSCANLGNWVQ